MLNHVSWNYDSDKKTFTFSGNFGYEFKKAMAGVGYSEEKQKDLFNNLTYNSLTIHRFFLPDLHMIFTLIVAKGSVYGVNLKVINKILDIIDNNIISDNKTRLKLDYAAISKNFKFEPLANQKPIYESYIDVRSNNGSIGMLLDAAVGTGKTYMSLTLAAALHSQTTLIVTVLPTVRSVWVKSISGKETLFKHPQRSYVIGDGGYTGESYIIAHYENIDKIVDFAKTHHVVFDTLIVDEVHSFNNIKSARTKSLLTVVDGINFKNTIIMSGTPIKAKATELLPLLKMINEDLTGKLIGRCLKLYKRQSWVTKEVLKSRYEAHTVTVKRSDESIPPITTSTTKIKLKNSKRYTLTQIRKRMSLYMETRVAELTANYPVYSKIYNTIYSKAKIMLLENGVDETTIKAYESAIASIIINYNNNTLARVPDYIVLANKFEKTNIEPLLSSSDKVKFRNAKTIYKYLILKAQGEALANVVMASRIDCYTELASEKGVSDFINAGSKKTIVFSSYVKVCDAVVNNAKFKKLNPIGVYGNTTKDLNRNINIYTHQANVNPLVTTYKSLSTGVPLTVANTVVIYGLPHRQYIFDQAVGRAWRTGQDTPVGVYVVELDTGDEPNITDRDFDIIDFYRQEVADFTGNQDGVIIERSIPELSTELGVSSLLKENDNYLDRAIKFTSDIITFWK